MKIAIAVPTPQNIPSAFARNLIGIITTTHKDFPDDDIIYIDRGGVRTDKNRNVMLEKLLEADVDYILWLDADMIYPLDIVKTYMEHEFDVIGCLYFKRTAPFDVVGYVDSTNPETPYRGIDPRHLPKNTVVEVGGLGFGGMMVNMDVYKKMGDDKWMNYGKNYHLPFKSDNDLTHDLVFCTKAKKYGYKILLHTGVRPGHIAEYVVTIDDWLRYRKEGVGRLTSKNINTEEYWDKKYKENAWEYSSDLPKQYIRWDKVLEFIKDGDVVLDIGCGMGEFLRYASERKNIFQLGIDISSYALEESYKCLPRGRFLQLDMNVDEIKQTALGEVDIVFCGELLEHLDNPQHLIRQAKGVLRKGGKLIMTVPNMNSIETPEHVFGYDKEMLLEMFGENTTVEPFNNDIFLLVIHSV